MLRAAILECQGSVAAACAGDLNDEITLIDFYNERAHILRMRAAGV